MFIAATLTALAFAGTINTPTGEDGILPPSEALEMLADPLLCQWYGTFMSDLDYFGVDPDFEYGMFAAPVEDFTWRNAVDDWFVENLPADGWEFSEAAQDVLIAGLANCPPYDPNWQGV